MIQHPQPEWCEHIKWDYGRVGALIGGEYSYGWFWDILRRMPLEGHLPHDWNFCPICGAKRPVADNREVSRSAAPEAVWEEW